MTNVIAHRGASAVAAENTLAAFELAVQLGADGVELDVRRSADRILVVSHDATYADGRAVAEVAYADRPDGVCNLADALEACAGASVNVEIKNMPGDVGFEADHGISDAVVEELARWKSPERFLVSSFNLETLDRVRAIDHAPATAFLTFVGGLDPHSVFALAVERGHAAVHPHDAQADGPYIAAAHAAGLIVNVWTVDDPERIAQLAASGADGVVTNVPDIARQALGKGPA